MEQKTINECKNTIRKLQAEYQEKIDLIVGLAGVIKRLENENKDLREDLANSIADEQRIIDLELQNKKIDNEAQDQFNTIKKLEDIINSLENKIRIAKMAFEDIKNDPSEDRASHISEMLIKKLGE